MRWNIDHSSPLRLQDQIAACVRGGVGSGELAPGERLPPAAELGEAVGVDRNTVLAAYRALRDEGVLEFRRGRGVRVAAAPPVASPVADHARELVDLARRHGVSTGELIRIIEELP